MEEEGQSFVWAGLRPTWRNIHQNQERTSLGKAYWQYGAVIPKTFGGDGSATPRGLPDMKHGICGSGVGWGGVLLVGELGCPIALGYCRLKAAPWMEYRWVRAVAYPPSPLQAQGLVVDFWCCRVLSSSFV